MRSVRGCRGPSPPGCGRRVLPRDRVNGKPGPASRRRLPAIDPLFSDLRHEGALRKYPAGWHLNEIQRLLGHRNIQQTSTYLGVGNDDRAQEMIAHGSGGKTACRRGHGYNPM